MLYKFVSKIFLAVVFWGLSLPCVTVGNTVKVVTTTSDLASIAESIGGDIVKVSSLQDGKRDPHFLQAKPSYIVKARKADLWIRIGMELEIGYEPVILDASRNTRIHVGNIGHLDASEKVIRLDIPTQKIDRSMGDVHPEGNPHYWLDPYNGRIIAEEIAERLQKLDPENTKVYEKNLMMFHKKLDEAMFGVEAVTTMGGIQLWELQKSGELENTSAEKGIKLGGWFEKLEPYRKNKIGSHHRSWNYLLNRFELELAVELESKPGIPPTAQHLNDVVETVKKQKVKAFLVEPFYSRKAADLVAERTDAKVIICPNATGGGSGADDYISMLDNAISLLAETLKE
jgi:ABC-type Zn uptake system ZnuABC Zn-binding protein ZnuA